MTTVSEVPVDEVLVTMVYEEGPLLDPGNRPRVLVAEGFRHPGAVRSAAAENVAHAVAKTLRQVGPPPSSRQWREVDELGVWVAYGWWESTVPGQPPREHFRRRRLRCVRVPIRDAAPEALEWLPVDARTPATEPFFAALESADGRARGR